ncbi:MAG: hypothetical protein ABIJ57_14995 [Pseudomonadota bacterium]
MPRYRAAYEDKSIAIPKDGDVMDDHRAVVMTKGVANIPDSKRTKGRRGEQRHGDSAIAGAMAWFAVKNGIPAVDVGSPPARREKSIGIRPGMSVALGGYFGRFKRTDRVDSEAERQRWA